MNWSVRLLSKTFSISLALWVFILSPMMTLSMLAPVRAATVNICHTSGGSGNWNALAIDDSAFQSHLDHGDFPYAGTAPVTPANNDADDDWCEGNVPTNQAPSISSHSNIEDHTTSLSGMAISYTNPSATDPDGNLVGVVCMPPSGSTFPIGITTVNCTATDTYGATDATSFTVTITQDPLPPNTPPSIDSHGDVSVTTSNPAGTTVTYANPGVSDPDGGDTVTVACTPASGSSFPVGTTTVTCTATDSFGATDTTTFNVIVTHTPPEFYHICHYEDGIGWSVLYVTPGALPHYLELGDIIYEGPDDSELSAAWCFAHTPNDPPVIAPHSNITETTSSLSGKVVTYADPTASDTHGDIVTVACTPASGSNFPVGTTTVTCTATDSFGATDTTSFSVIITLEDGDTTPPTTPGNLHFNNPALSCGSFTVVNSNTVDWDDATDDSGIAGYDYFVDYPLVGGGRGTWQTFVTASQYSGSLNEGVHHIRVRALDNEGNYSEWTPYCDITLDTTVPAVPTGLHRDNAARTTSYACSAVATRQTLIPDWNDIVGDTSFSHFEYSSFNVGGSQGINEQVLTSSEFVHSWVPPTDGTYGYAVRSVDLAGNKSAWALSSETLAGSCQITYDSQAPDVDITSPTSTVLSGTVAIRGSVTDDNPHHYWLVIQNAGGTTVAGPGTVNDSTSFVDKFFFNWNTTLVPDGNYVIKLEARDAAGNKDAGSVEWMSVTVDNTPPFLTLPPNMTEEAASADGSFVDFSPEPSATDAFSGDLPVICSPISGSLFPIGTTTVNCSATDSQGNTANGSFTVTVQDTTLPEITVPADISRPTETLAGEVVLFEASAFDVIDGNLPVTCVPESGSVFPYGTTLVTCSATDSSGNTGSATFNITLYDGAPPVTTDNHNDDLWHSTDVTVDLTCTDNIDSPCAHTYYQIDGGVFFEGTSVTVSDEGYHTIGYYSIDNSGNEEELNLDTVKIDKTLPFLTIPEDQVFDETSTGTYPYSFTATATERGGDELDLTVTIEIPTDELSVTCSHDPAGHEYEVGTTEVECSATDRAGNIATESFTVTVNNVAPLVSASAIQNANRSFTFTANPTGGNLPYTYSWSGDCTGTAISTTTGTAAGTYTCLVTVFDADGDFASASISRTITPVLPVVADIIEAVEAATTTEEETPPGELPSNEGILGERTCNSTVKLVGLHYYDANKNGQKDEKEQVYSNITGKVTYFVEEKEFFVANFMSNSDGKWELSVCPGDYVITLNQNSIPKGLADSLDNHKVTAPAEQPETLVLLALLSTTAWWWSWWWLLLILFILVVIYYLYKKRKEYHEQQGQ